MDSLTTLPADQYAALAEFYLEITRLCREFEIEGSAIPVGLAIGLATIRGGYVNISTISTLLHMPRSSVQHTVRRMQVNGLVVVDHTDRETKVRYRRLPKGFVEKRDRLFRRTIERLTGAARIATSAADA